MRRVIIFDLNSFFEQFRSQMAFYIGCIKLHKEIEKFNGETCFPQILMYDRKNKAKKLYDLGLALQMNEKPISNDLDGGKLYIISGANQGGKSTFLRSIGVAQVMMQAGMFVPAAYFEGNIFDHIFTHFSRREDVAMNSGRLDEEKIEHVIFLSAERQRDGLRTFKMVQQRPEETSFGLDLYDQIIKRK